MHKTHSNLRSEYFVTLEGITRNDDSRETGAVGNCAGDDQGQNVRQSGRRRIPHRRIPQGARPGKEIRGNGQFNTRNKLVDVHVYCLLNWVWATFNFSAMTNGKKKTPKLRFMIPFTIIFF